jgi:hypothetical protein
VDSRPKQVEHGDSGGGVAQGGGHLGEARHLCPVVLGAELSKVGRGPEWRNDVEMIVYCIKKNDKDLCAIIR